MLKQEPLRGLMQEETGFAAGESGFFVIFITCCKSTTYKMSFLIGRRQNEEGKKAGFFRANPEIEEDGA